MIYNKDMTNTQIAADKTIELMSEWANRRYAEAIANGATDEQAIVAIRALMFDMIADKAKRDAA